MSLVESQSPKKKLKILFFDSWTKGIHNFAPISADLKNRGIDSLLVHVGSWEHDKNRPLEESIQEVICRDIRYYKTNSIYTLLKIERPNLILILTTNYILDRSVILAARSLCIPSTFLMHGIRETGDNIRSQKSTPNASLNRQRWTLIGKYIRFILPNYFISGTIENKMFPFRIAPYLLILKTFLWPHRYVLYPPPTDEIHCDLALVFGNVYKDLFVNEYGYPPNRIKVVGHPQLDSLIRLMRKPGRNVDKSIFINKYSIRSDRPYCVYLEMGTVEQGAQGWTTRNRISHLEQIATICNNAGRQLVIKTHPATDEIPIKAHFAQNDHVIVISDVNLNLLLYWSESAIGLGSTTNDLVFCLKKPLLLPAFGLSKRMSEVVYERQPFALLCRSPDELLYYLSHPKESTKLLSSKDSKSYLSDVITFTDGNSIARICDALIREVNMRIASTS